MGVGPSVDGSRSARGLSCSGIRSATAMCTAPEGPIENGRMNSRPCEIFRQPPDVNDEAPSFGAFSGFHALAVNQASGRNNIARSKPAENHTRKATTSTLRRRVSSVQAIVTSVQLPTETESQPTDLTQLFSDRTLRADTSLSHASRRSPRKSPPAAEAGRRAGSRASARSRGWTSRAALRPAARPRDRRPR